MNLFFEKGMTGSILCISKRYSNTNNKHLTSYDPKKSTKYTWTKTIYMIMLFKISSNHWI